MKTMLRASFLFFTLFAAIVAQATPTIDSLNLQGYMKKANGAAVTDGTYNIAIGVFQNGTAIWGKSSSVSVTSGLFSVTLNGTGSDLSALPVATNMNASFTGATLNPSLLDGSANGGVSYRVYAVDPIDGANPTFDVTVNSVPTAFVASIARSVPANSVTLTNLATSAYTATTAASKLVQTDGSGKIDSSFLPAADASTMTGTVAIAQGGTGATTSTAARTALSAAKSGANSDITSLTGLSTAISLAQGGTGATSAAAARTALSAASSGANSDITALSGLSTAISIAQGGTGATSAAAARTALAAAASGANSDITSLTGLSTALSVAQGGTGAASAAAARTALSAAASGANSDITALSGLTGAITTSGNITQSGATTFSTGTGAISLNGNAAMAAGKSLMNSVLPGGVATAATINALAHGGNTMVYLTGNTATALNGIAAGTNGQLLYITSQGTGNITIAHNSASATAGNKIFTTTGAAVASAGASAWILIYQTTASGVATSGWYLMSSSL